MVMTMRLLTLVEKSLEDSEGVGCGCVASGRVACVTCGAA